MAWLYVPESVDSNSGSSSSASTCPSSAGSRRTNLQQGRSSLGKATESSTPLRSGKISRTSTRHLGEGSTSSPPAGLARATRPHPEVDNAIPTSGPRSEELSKRCARELCSSKTFPLHHGSWLKTNSSLSDSVQLGVSFARLLWERRTRGRAFTCWPTPTKKANHGAPSMRKWPAYRLFQNMVEKPSPELWEWMMGLPPEWSDYSASAKASYRKWLRAHSSSWQGS